MDMVLVGLAMDMGMGMELMQGLILEKSHTH